MDGMIHRDLTGKVKGDSDGRSAKVFLLFDKHSIASGFEYSASNLLLAAICGSRKSHRSR